MFSGLGGGDLWSEIVQPVLQWGISPAGGGNYWSICNWYACGNGHFFYDSLIKVSPGTKLQGVVRLTSVSDNLFSYNSSFQGYTSGLQVNNISQLSTPSFALEAYNVQSCDEYPIDEKIKMSNIQILLDNIYPPLLWHTCREVSDCGQFSEVIRESSNDGEVYIHFHTASSIDNFDDIHIYPNPAGDFLHVSPNEPITDCKIELFNCSGKLILTNQYNYLDYELNIDLQNYSDGIYFIRFSYNNKSHTFKILKADTK
ncbi:MAG TPA: T9SS type A sorting domain-containing protein [Bacteroidales bacterium]|nr:T9SS type A sorting domain-containing protein [Bacteroidales bacterium]